MQPPTTRCRGRCCGPNVPQGPAIQLQGVAAVRALPRCSKPRALAANAAASACPARACPAPAPTMQASGSRMWQKGAELALHRHARRARLGLHEHGMHRILASDDKTRPLPRESERSERTRAQENTTAHNKNACYTLSGAQPSART